MVMDLIIYKMAKIKNANIGQLKIINAYNAILK